MDYKVKDNILNSVYSDVLEIAQADFIEWEKLKNSTVLITGANGFIGSYLVFALLLRNDLYNDNIGIFHSLNRLFDLLCKVIQRNFTWEGAEMV